MRTFRAVSVSTTIYLLYCIAVLKGDLQKRKIIGGNLAESIPYQASLQFNNHHRCGAVIISKTIVLTAAHCVEDHFHSSMYSVRAGSNQHFEGGQLVPVIYYLTHPKYNFTTYEYDIAIIFLDKPFKFDGKVQPVKMIEANAPIPTGVNAVISGWGVTSDVDFDFSNELRFAHVPLVNQTVCKNNVGIIEFTDRMLCTGYLEGGVDACQKDSGGPLVVNSILIGLVSIGDGCGQPNKLGVYTNVAVVREWIDDWISKYNYLMKVSKRKSKTSNTVRKN